MEPNDTHADNVRKCRDEQNAATNGDETTVSSRSSALKSHVAATTPLSNDAQTSNNGQEDEMALGTPNEYASLRRPHTNRYQHHGGEASEKDVAPCIGTTAREKSNHGTPPNALDSAAEETLGGVPQQEYFWKSRGRQSSSTAQGEVTWTAADAPVPRHVDQELCSGRAKVVNRRWIRFAGPGAVQMEVRAPYSGGFARRFLGTRQPLHQREQQEHPRHFQEQRMERATNENSNTGDTFPEQAMGLHAFVVKDASENEDEGTVIEGVQLPQIEQDDRNTAAVSRHATLKYILLSVLILAAIVSLTTRPQWRSSGSTQEEAVVDRPKETISVQETEDEFPVEVTNLVETITSRRDLLLPGSSQNRALKWMLSHDPSTMRSPDDSRFLQRYILGVLSFAAKLDINLPTSSHFLDKDRDECTWRGISCTPNNDRGSVTTINPVENAGLMVEAFGTLPSELGALPELTNIYAFGAGLFGTIPPELANAKRLKMLVLVRNHLEGPFPSTFGNHSSLTYLSLSRNEEFGGTLPDALFTIPTLTHVYLEWCNITGSIPSFLGRLDQMKVFSVTGNRLTGTLPSDLGHLWNMEQLFVDHNELSGPLLRPILALWPLLTLLRINDNRFSGQIEHDFAAPQENAMTYRGREFHLHHNQFTGTIPSTLANLSPLHKLTLHGNLFQGSVPIGLCEVTNDRSVVSLNLTADCARPSKKQSARVQCHCCEICL